jgi:hypothetical protein
MVLHSSGINVLTNPGCTTLRYDPTANQFISNWQTKGLSNGTYTLTLSLADGTSYKKVIQLTNINGSMALSTTSVGGVASGSRGLPAAERSTARESAAPHGGPQLAGRSVKFPGASTVRAQARPRSGQAKLPAVAVDAFFASGDSLGTRPPERAVDDDHIEEPVRLWEAALADLMSSASPEFRSRHVDSTS